MARELLKGRLNTTSMARWSVLFVMMLIQTRASLALAQMDKNASAREHFQRGVNAFNESRFDEAALEFEQAYRLEPSPVVLYNIGQVHALLGNPVEAIAAYENYLSEGGRSVSPERRAEVRAEMERQRSKIGTVSVVTNPPGASVRVDGNLIGTTPLPRSVPLKGGHHTIDVQLADYASEAREVDVSAKTELHFDFALRRLSVADDGNPVPSISDPSPQAARRSDSGATEPPKAVLNETSPGHAGEPLRVAGYVLGAIGLVAAGTGCGLAIQSADAAASARDRLVKAAGVSMPKQSDLDAYDGALSDYNAAKRRNQLGWEIAAVGAAVLVGGVVLVAVSPGHQPSAGMTGLTGIAPIADRGGGGLLFEGAW